MHRPTTTFAEQLFLAGLLGKYTGGSKPLQEPETYDSGPEPEQEGNRTQAVVSGVVSTIAPAARAAQQFMSYY